MKQVTQNAIDTHLKNVSTRINPDKIDEILNLPKQFRWYAAKQLLNYEEYQIVEITGIRKSAPKKFIKEYAQIAERFAQTLAYKSANFGRYQSTHPGQSVFPSHVKVRHSTGERYWRKFMSHDLYSDFFFSASDVNNFEFLIKILADEKPHKISFFDLEIYRGKVYDRNREFVYNNPLFKKVGFLFDRKDISITYGEMRYHIEDLQVFAAPSKNEELVKQIITAFQTRKRNAKKEAAFTTANMESVVVTIEDSVRAGNCEYGTKKFADQHFKKEMAENIPITAAMILKVRNDQYTRRAILAAL